MNDDVEKELQVALFVLFYMLFLRTNIAIEDLE